MEFAGSFLERIKKRAEKNPKTPCWQGELYLEYHRGTYTSMAQNKKLNRRSEFLYENAEMLSVTAQKLLGKERALMEPNKTDNVFYSFLITKALRTQSP